MSGIRYVKITVMLPEGKFEQVVHPKNPISLEEIRWLISEFRKDVEMFQADQKD